MESEILICKCGDPEHQLVVTTDEADKVCYVAVHLISGSFLQRLKYGIKYIFGHKSIFGCFDEVILDESHVSKLEKIIDYIKNE